MVLAAFTRLGLVALSLPSDALSISGSRRIEPVFDPAHVATTSIKDEEVAAAGHFSGPSWDPLLNFTFDTNVTDKNVTNGRVVSVEAESLERGGVPATSRLGLTQHELLCKLRHTVGLSGVVWAEPQGRMKARFATCAVVSSSGVLKKHQHGFAIDGAHMVMRFNAAPTVGFAYMVGSRDDMRLVNNAFVPRSLGKPEDWRDEEVLRNHSAWYQVQMGTSYAIVPMAPVPLAGEFSRTHPQNDLYMLDQAVHDQTSQAIQGIYNSSWLDPNTTAGVSFIPTTGAVGMMVALHLCDEVRAYGMAATPAASTAQYSYFDPNYGDGEVKADQNAWHKTFSAEKDLWRRISSTPPAELDATEVAVIPGFSQIQCAPHQPPAAAAWRSTGEDDALR